ncbi:Ribonuclease T(2) [Bertholletia excelsa]
MAGKSVFFFLGCLLAFALLNEAALAQPYNGFEYMKLALQWPACYCQLQNCKEIPSYFTIHGLWPDNYTGKGLAKCYNKPYVTITDAALLQRLNTSWPNLLRKQSNNKLWSHEWTEHGTCSLSRYNQTQYFEKALELKARYDLIGHMKTQGVSPGPNATYSAQKIIQVVQGLTGKVPDVFCEKKRGKQFLSEIRICFVPSGDNTTDCPKGRGTPQCSGDAAFPAPPSGGAPLSA